MKFKVTQRGVRERVERLQKKHLEKKKEEESASAIAVDDVTELETLIDEIIDREKLAEESRDSEGALKKIEADKQTAEKCEKRPWSDLVRQKKDMNLRVIKGGRPNEGGVEMTQWNF